mmetsp:Transcript_4644/g.6965  ORF Transcript_4644/g.6965 Transcript_4644/m.6965 type:complete len:116 (+) Transcript_4644:729-1076(+)
MTQDVRASVFVILVIQSGAYVSCFAYHLRRASSLVIMGSPQWYKFLYLFCRFPCSWLELLLPVIAFEVLKIVCCTRTLTYNIHACMFSLLSPKLHACLSHTAFNTKGFVSGGLVV